MYSLYNFCCIVKKIENVFVFIVELKNNYDSFYFEIKPH